MRFNTTRGHRLAFGNDAEAYDKGRLPVPSSVVDKLVIDLGEGCTGVVEVGAGTGQLTCSLLERGQLVWAVEPDARLAEVLQSNCPSASLRVIGADFEDVELPDLRTSGGGRAVVAANAFHWLDPTRALDRAAALLAPGERLVLYWSYPMWKLEADQRAFNGFVSPMLADLVRDPDTHWATIEESAAAGRQEVLSHGGFALRSWAFSFTEEQRAAAEMADLWASFGSTAGSRPTVLEAVERTLSSVGADLAATKTLHYVVGYTRQGPAPERMGSTAADAVRGGST
jgi:SAM-dependent methyltransferase